jgi:hypothetical protein
MGRRDYQADGYAGRGRAGAGVGSAEDGDGVGRSWAKGGVYNLGWGWEGFWGVQDVEIQISISSTSGPRWTEETFTADRVGRNNQMLK